MQRPVSLFLRECLLASLVIIAPSLWSAGTLPTAVPDSELETSPYRFAGLLRTDSYGRDPSVIGSGWVASPRVVATAAHVFFVDETLGWNRNRWYWRRAASRGEYWNTTEMMTPRSYRVLAGYATAATRLVSNPGTIDDAFNRDTMTLLFYRDVIEGPPAPRAVGQLSGSGEFSIMGYPAELGGLSVPEIAMYAHIGGRNARYTRIQPAQDFQGYPVVVFETPDIVTGPGASGGPVIRRINGTWTVVGIHVGGTTDHDRSIDRELDEDVELMLDQSAADSVDGSPGTLLRVLNNAANRPPIRREDGSWAYLAYDGVRAVDATGAELWHRLTGSLGAANVSEAPDGRIIVTGASDVAALDGVTGAFLWRVPTTVRYTLPAVIGELGEIYMGGENRIASFATDGALRWAVDLPDGGTGRASIAIGADRTLYVTTERRLYALDHVDGSTRWQSEDLGNVDEGSVAVAPDGGVLVSASNTLRMFNPDGSSRWSYPHGAYRPVINRDGTVAIFDNDAAQFIKLGTDGTELQRMSLSGAALVRDVAVDREGGIYLATPAAIMAYNSSGEFRWQVNGQIDSGPYLGRGSELAFIASTPGQITIVAAGAPGASETWNAATGGFDLARRVFNTLPVAPQIVAGPGPKRVVVGTRLELEVAVTGSYPLDFQWRRNGEPLTSQVGRRLIVESAQPTDAGAYTVMVRNLAGEATSAPVEVEVGDAAFGDVLWNTDLESLAAPAVGDDGTTYVVAKIPDLANTFFSIELVALDPSGRELWRFPFTGHSVSTNTPPAPPVVGDQGQLFVSGWSSFWSISAEGQQEWRYDYYISGGTPSANLALGRDGRLYAQNREKLFCFEPTGEVVWEKPWGMTGDILVRHDGQLIGLSFGSLVQPDGSRTPYIEGTNGLVGPNDELVVQTPSAIPFRFDELVVDRYGRVRAREVDSPSGYPGLLLANGNLVNYNSGVRLVGLESFSSVVLTSTNLAQPLAALEGNRVLVTGDNSATVYDEEGRKVAEAPTGSGRHLYAFRSDGALIGGKPLRAYAVGWTLASTPWPHLRADSRNTRRAPATFEFAPATLQSIEIMGADAELYSGYEMILHAQAHGPGPLTYQWRHNGAILAGQTNADLVIQRPSVANEGTYTVEARNGTSAVTSNPVAIDLLPPTPAVPGAYTGTWHLRNQDTFASFVFVLRPDRTFEANFFGPGGNSFSGRLGPTGDLVAALNSSNSFGSFIGQTLVVGDVATIDAMEPLPSGTTPNGIPVGAYHGWTTDARGLPGNAIVFPDGTISVQTPYYTSSSFQLSGAFDSDHRTVRLTAPNATHAFDLEATTTGIVHLIPVTPSAGMTDCYLIWDGRPPVERLVNLSTRGYVSPNTPPLIAGFVVAGSNPHSVLLRGVGPELAYLGLDDALARPRVRLVSSAGIELARNEGWGGNDNVDEIRSASARLAGLQLHEGSTDAALFRVMAPGLYSLILEPQSDESGVALVELYEDATPETSSRLGNISTRAILGSGAQTLIGGFYVTGEVPKTLLIRAAGPALLPYAGGAFIPAADPRIRVYRAGETATMAENDDWTVYPPYGDIEPVAERIGAFPFARESKDAGLLITLPPGGYTVTVDNLDPNPGVGLLEIYEVNP